MINNNRPPEASPETEEARIKKINKFQMELTEAINIHLAYKLEISATSEAMIARKKAEKEEVERRKAEELRPGNEGDLSALKHSAQRAVDKLGLNNLINGEKAKISEVGERAYDIAHKQAVEEKRSSNTRQQLRKFDDVGEIFAAAANNLIKNLPNNEKIKNIGVDFKQTLSNHFKAMLAGTFDLAEFDKDAEACKKRFEEEFKALLETVKDDPKEVEKVTAQKNAALAAVERIRVEGVENQFNRLKESIKRANEIQYQDLMLHRIGFEAGKILWKRIDNLDPNNKDGDALVQFGGLDLEDGIYQKAGSKHTFKVKDGNISLTTADGDMEAYSEMMDFAAAARGARTVVIDWPSASSVNFNMLKDLIALAKEKGLHVEIGDNVKLAMVQRTKATFLDGPRMDVDERGYKFVDDAIKNNTLFGKVASKLRALGRYFAGPTQVEIYALLRDANRSADRKEKNMMLRLDAVGDKTKELESILKELNAENMTDEDKLKAIKKAKEALVAIEQDLIANPGSPNVDNAHDMMKKCHAAVEQLITSLPDDNVEKAELIKWAKEFKDDVLDKKNKEVLKLEAKDEEGDIADPVNILGRIKANIDAVKDLNFLESKNVAVLSMSDKLDALVDATRSMDDIIKTLKGRDSKLTSEEEAELNKADAIIKEKINSAGNASLSQGQKDDQLAELQKWKNKFDIASQLEEVRQAQAGNDNHLGM